jgi:hypothetical protein
MYRVRLTSVRATPRRTSQSISLVVRLPRAPSTSPLASSETQAV